MARILVTGGAGFIGAHLCERLLAEGHRVLCLDSFESGSEETLRPLRSSSRFEVLRHDVAEPFDVDVEEIYNLACPASPAIYGRDPLRTMRTNVLGAMNVLDLAARTGATVLQASTSEVYGDPAYHPQSECSWGNVNPIGPRACYTEGKRAAEALFFDHRRVHGTRIKVARLFNVFGPRMQIDDGRVVSSFIVRALRGEALTLYGGGKQTRSFCYVDDAVEGLIRLMATAESVTGPVNLGNPAEISIAVLAERIAHLAGRDGGAVVPMPLPQDDPTRRCPDISLAREILGGWCPVVSLEEGLRRTITYFRDTLAVEHTPLCTT